MQRNAVPPLAPLSSLLFSRMLVVVRCDALASRASLEGVCYFSTSASPPPLLITPGHTHKTQNSINADTPLRQPIFHLTKGIYSDTLFPPCCLLRASQFNTKHTRTYIPLKRVFSFPLFTFLVMEGLSVRHRDAVRPGDEAAPTRTAVLHLRPAPTAAEVEQAERQRTMRVTWDPEVREPQNQQVSKCCCVFHKKKLFGESSSDSSSSSDSDDDDGQHPAPMPGGAGGPSDHDEAAGGVGGHAHDGCAHGCTHDAKPRRRRPKCTKDHCYCGTTFH